MPKPIQLMEDHSTGRLTVRTNSSDTKTMKFAFIATYPPRQCGIGTFTQDLLAAITKQHRGEVKQHEAFVVAMDDETDSYDFPQEVALTIRQEQQTDYLKAAHFINYSGADVCILEHEYGIFGGQNGVYILPLLHRLQIPVIVTLHTVLRNPSYNEREVLKEICRIASRVVVMNAKAIDFLQDIYNVDATKIDLIEHGVPDFYFDHITARQSLKLQEKKTIVTFGFLSRNKGIETVIRALPAVVKAYPETVYIVLGKTHPGVIRHSGEEYRINLLRLVKKLGLEKHVVFINEFINQRDLFEYLHASDVYITPYMNEAQITSGTLSYAVGAGTVVMSTPYWHAEELLAENRGLLFDFGDDGQLSEMLLGLFADREKMSGYRERAYAYGQELTWPKVGGRYIALGSKVVEEFLIAPESKDSEFDPDTLPPFSIAHVQRLTDSTGIIQHAKYGIPNWKEGYCLDDNARALLMALMAHRQLKHKAVTDLMPTYLSYIHYMQKEDGSFRNFMSYSRQFLDETGSEDSFGRAVWALGYLFAAAPNDAFFQAGREMFFRAMPHFEKLQSIRSIANCMLGVCHYLKWNPQDEGMVAVLKNMAIRLTSQYKQHREENWHWFEELLAYDNALLPLAVLSASEFLPDPEFREIGLESMSFLAGITLREGYLSVVGNEEWHKKGCEGCQYGQQPLDAMGMVLMFHKAYVVTGDKSYLDKLFTSFMWFLGENDLRMSLYDFETNGCCDGLERHGINRNQGAESTLAYLISQLTVLEAFNDFYKKAG